MRAILKRNGAHFSLYDAQTGDKLPSVTGITSGGLPKPALLNWSADATAEYAVDNWDSLSAMAVGTRLSAIKKGRYQKRDAASGKGKAVHTMGEKLLAGEKVVVPDALAGYVRSYAQFMDAFDLRALHVERAVYSTEFWYGGRFDILADVVLPDLPEYDHIGRDGDGYARGLLDAKTSKSGIFGETALQLAAYRYCDRMILPDGADVDMPDVDFVAGVHIREDGADLVLLHSDEDVWRDFLHCKEVARIEPELKRLVLGKVPAPNSARRLEMRVAE
jgi:hypothetical protein